MVRAKENDENLQPLDRPNMQVAPDDSDRMRFGFRLKRQPSGLCTAGGSPDAAAGGKQETPSTSDAIRADAGLDIVSADAKACASLVERVHLSKLVGDTLGDIDGLLPLLKMKPTADKYNFKERIKDLESIVQPMKDGLFDQRRRCKMLVDVLLVEEERINARLQSSMHDASLQRELKHEVLMELDALQQQERERTRQLKQLRESLDAAHRDREPLQVRLIAQARRADEAEALIRERDAEIVVLRRQLDEANAASQAHEQHLVEAFLKLDVCKFDCKKQIDEAANLLREQVDEAGRDRQSLLTAAQQRENELAADRDHLQARLVEIESHLAITQEARDNANLMCAQLRQELATLIDTAENEQRALQLHLDAKDQLLAERDADASHRITSLEHAHKVRLDQLAQQQKMGEDDHAAKLISLQRMHEAEIEAVHEQLRMKEAKHEANMQSAATVHKTQLQGIADQFRLKEMEIEIEVQSIKTAHQADLDRVLLQMETKAANMDAEGQSVKNACQARLTEMEEQLRTKEAEHQSAIQCATNLHQARLAELKEQLRLKEIDHQAGLQSIMLIHKSQLDEKDYVLQQKDDTLRESIQSLKAMHQMQFDQKDESLRQKDITMRQSIDSIRSLYQIQLDEKDDLLRQRDCDLRESIQSIAVMHCNNNEQILHERQRAQRLEEDVQGLRTNEEGLRRSVHSLAQDRDRVAAELNACKEKVVGLHSDLRVAQSERDWLVDQGTENKVAMQKLQDGLAVVSTKLRSVQEEHHGTSNQQQMDAIADLKLTVERLTTKVDSSQLELGERQDNISKQRMYILALEEKLRNADGERRELHNAIQELKGNIRVFCRVRPAAETAIHALQSLEANKLTVSCNGESHVFAFDRVFVAAAAQESVFEEVGGLVQSALDGYKVCIFAYGQTGSGKTYTMQGTNSPAGWGLIPRSLRQIFKTSEAMREKGWEWSLRASFLEIYNETFRDLLRSEDDGAPLPHAIKHDDAWGAVVTNMGCHEVNSLEQINVLMAKAARQRSVASTEMNSISSRSHSVFALYLKGVNNQFHSELHGALHLVDLAGSERLQRSGATGDRLKETQNINRSLSSLADVFLAKAEGRAHIPFRNSKLTHLMEPCLSGQGKTLMLVNVGPEQDNAHETLCSLRFAGQVSQCDTGGRPKRHAKSTIGTSVALSPAPSSRPQTPARPQAVGAASGLAAVPVASATTARRTGK